MRRNKSLIVIALFTLVLSLSLLLVACTGSEGPVGPQGPAGPPGPTSSPLAGLPGTPVRPGSPPEPATVPGYKGPFSFGKDATKEEIAAWNINIFPDGTNLPLGRGTVAQGSTIFAAKCVFCHGANGEGISGLGDPLIKPYDPKAPWPQEPRTIGNYWPYATTVYDYIYRAMPYIAPGSLTPDEVYSLTAWLLFKNGIITENTEMDAQSLPKVQMPAKDKFLPFDPRDTFRFQ